MYKVCDPEGNLYALKVLKPDETLMHILGPDKVQEWFDKEIKVMTWFRHEHLARVVENGWHRGRPFMVLEYLCLNLGLIMGAASDSEKQSRILSPLRALSIAEQTLDALGALHEKGIIHRDVKPENIMLTREGLVRLIDFGLFRFKGMAENNPPGLVMGSPYYAAPEQIDDPDQADERADLYSLGVVLHRMVSGVFPEQSQNTVADQSVFGSDWDGFLEKAVSPDPDLRFQSTWAMLDQVKNLEKEWTSRRDQVCAMHKPRNIRLSAQFLNLRSKPVHTGKDHSTAFAGLDSLMQPQQFVHNVFQKQKHGFLDLSTGLIWGLEIPEEQFNFTDAGRHVYKMNKDPLCSQEDVLWRLPTVDELITLIQPRNSLEDFCFPLLWRLQTRAWLWSADTQTRFKAWIVDMEQGAVMAVDRMCRFYVLPVAGG